MIPLRDENPSNLRPLVTVLIIVACTGIFFLVQSRDPAAGAIQLYEQATIPCEITGRAALTVDEISRGVCESKPGVPAFPEKSILASLVFSLFLHGSLFHLLGNMWVLWIFGNNVEDRMRHWHFGAFYVVGGLLASLAHVLRNPDSTLPVVGASGAIAAVMGAYLVLFPRHRVVAVIPPFFLWPFRVPALIFLGLWFAGQFALNGQETLIAWEAHAAGFVVGASYAALRRRRLLDG